MILLFEVNGEVIRLQVTSDRDVYWKGRNTNDKWVSFDKIAELSKQDPTSIRLTNLIIRSLPTKDDVIDYIIYEMRKAGLRHLRTE